MCECIWISKNRAVKLPYNVPNYLPSSLSAQPRPSYHSWYFFVNKSKIEFLKPF